MASHGGNQVLNVAPQKERRRRSSRYEAEDDEGEVDDDSGAAGRYKVPPAIKRWVTG